MCVAAPGSISNIIPAFILGLFIRSMVETGKSFDPGIFSGILIYMLAFVHIINLVPAFFNNFDLSYEMEIKFRNSG